MAWGGADPVHPAAEPAGEDAAGKYYVPHKVEYEVRCMDQRCFQIYLIVIYIYTFLDQLAGSSVLASLFYFAGIWKLSASVVS